MHEDGTWGGEGGRRRILEFATIVVETGSGAVEIKVGSAPNTILDLSTGSGEFTVDFPLQLIRKSADTLEGRLGDGKGRITIETGSGDISISHGSATSRRAPRPYSGSAASSRA